MSVIPVALLVVLNETVTEGLDSNEPTGHSLVDEGGVGTPAEGIAMDNGRALH